MAPGVKLRQGKSVSFQKTIDRISLQIAGRFFLGQSILSGMNSLGTLMNEARMRLKHDTKMV